MTLWDIGQECFCCVPLHTDCCAKNVFNLIKESLQYNTVQYTIADSHSSEVWLWHFLLVWLFGYFFCIHFEYLLLAKYWNQKIVASPWTVFTFPLFKWWYIKLNKHIQFKFFYFFSRTLMKKFCRYFKHCDVIESIQPKPSFYPGVTLAALEWETLKVYLIGLDRGERCFKKQDWLFFFIWCIKPWAETNGFGTSQMADTSPTADSPCACLFMLR